MRVAASASPLDVCTCTRARACAFLPAVWPQVCRCYLEVKDQAGFRNAEVTGVEAAPGSGRPCSPAWETRDVSRCGAEQTPADVRLAQQAPAPDETGVWWIRDGHRAAPLTRWLRRRCASRAAT